MTQSAVAKKNADNKLGFCANLRCSNEWLELIVEEVREDFTTELSNHVPIHECEAFGTGLRSSLGVSSEIKSFSGIITTITLPGLELIIILFPGCLVVFGDTLCAYGCRSHFHHLLARLGALDEEDAEIACEVVTDGSVIESSHTSELFEDGAELAHLVVDSEVRDNVSRVKHEHVEALEFAWLGIQGRPVVSGDIE